MPNKTQKMSLRAFQYRQTEYEFIYTILWAPSVTNPFALALVSYSMYIFRRFKAIS